MPLGYATLETHRSLKARIRQRYGDQLHVDTVAPLCGAAQHPRWAQLGLASTSATTLADAVDQWHIAEPAKRAKMNALGPNYSPEEEVIRNDYNQYFIDSGLVTLPASWIMNTSYEKRFYEHPRLQRLLAAKRELVETHSIPATYCKTDLRTWMPTVDRPHALPPELRRMQYDVILLDPPLASYAWDEPGHVRESSWTWDEIEALPIPQLASHDSFIFLWVGSGTSDGLERGREVLARWGYRRCEDIVWVRTRDASNASLLNNTVQHCLMGIQGTVVRSTDSFFVHCNVDTDVIVWEGEPDVPGGRISLRSKPHELYHTIENFCLGTRRLELFGRNRNLRRGWLTVGQDLGPDAKGWKEQAVPLSATYLYQFGEDIQGCPLSMRSNKLPFSEECELLRPKTPPRLQRGRQAQALVAYAPQQAPIAMYSPQYPAYAPMPTYLYPHTYPYPGMIPPPYPYPMYHAPHAPVPFSPSVPSHVYRPQPQRSALLCQGAGRRERVSVPSGSERFSGAQMQVLD
ncbi:mRNA (2'-O-methyladenosine-N(6)-)-methyltransferase [Malassezia vespertilionis]|uniref:MT-A70-domain-containing protein n=1 Tax=Malassezia vespertilionis TaxID=2020962 RepID=A0A2N1J9V0_9BASI|nr:mRNA (2'-O-methyladenosine-N(6)-)-methyltransferase [Malassezia vespertilionis]PKI83328.1 hypothetical protein MVES_003033 [Malassezia vespertilionis]WFD07822.1 mRNA (2'-O-methyladenosine-N(6)-)-methyltransferase [Malassezia vespertilionis]